MLKFVQGLSLQMAEVVIYYSRIGAKAYFSVF